MADVHFAAEDSAHPDSRPSKRQVRTRAQPKLTPALYKASVKTIAETTQVRDSSSTANIDDAILERIKKCLQRANHKNTPESEAKAAFFLASRLMGQYNVSQAEVLAHESAETQQQYAGQSVVSIKRADGSNKAVSNQGFVQDLACAMVHFFDCKCYSTQRSASVEWTFYGIAENTAAAVTAFEMAYNLISEWARPYKGIASKSSYCIGVAKELYSMARAEKRAQEQQAIEAEVESTQQQVHHEDLQRQAELDRLNFMSNSPEDMLEGRSDVHIKAEEGDDEDIIEVGAAPDFVENEVHVDDQADLDIEIKKLVKPERATPTPFDQGRSTPAIPTNSTQIPPDQRAGTEPPTIKKEEDDDETSHTSLWASSMQLTTFRANATRIADDYLKAKGVKLSKSRSRFAGVSDYSAYVQGIRDSKKIDIHRRRIEA